MSTWDSATAERFVRTLQKEIKQLKVDCDVLNLESVPEEVGRITLQLIEEFYGLEDES